MVQRSTFALLCGRSTNARPPRSLSDSFLFPLHLHQERAAAALNGEWIITTLIESKQAAGKFKRPPLVLVWMRLNRHPIDLIVFHDPFRKG